MTLDEAIKHCEEMAYQKDLESGFETDNERYAMTDKERADYKECASEHRQLAEWLKELKAYREQRGQRMKIGDEVYIHGYVDEIRQNVVIIRNDGGYFGTVAEEITSRSEIPNTCDDAISREELIEALDTWDKFGYAPTNELIPLRGSADKDKYVPYIHYDDVIECIKGMPSVSPRPTQSDDAISRQAVLDLAEWFDLNRQHFIVANLIDEVENMPSVTPQPRAGQWIEHFDEIGKWYECDQCHTDWGGAVNYCPNCGAKMEVEE